MKSPTALHFILFCNKQIHTIHIYCPPGPSALNGVVPDLLTEKAKCEGLLAAAVPISPTPTSPQTNQQASLSAAELWKQLCSHNSVSAQTQLMFFVGSKAIWYAIHETHTHMHAHMYISSVHKLCYGKMFSLAKI